MTDFKKQLFDHLNNRIEEVEENIDFLKNDGFQTASSEETLKRIQFYENWKKTGHKKHPADFEKELEQFKAKYNLSTIEHWKESVAKLQYCDNKLELLDCFAQIEESFEELETLVSDAAIELDEYIQTEIDRRRGK